MVPPSHEFEFDDVDNIWQNKEERFAAQLQHKQLGMILFVPEMLVLMTQGYSITVMS